MTLEIEITREDYVDYNKHYFLKKQLKRTIIIAIIFIFCAELFLNKDGFDIYVTVISTIIYVSLLFFTIRRRLLKTGNVPQDNGSILGKRTFQFNDNQIECKTPDSSSIHKWSSIQIIEEGKSAVYLFVDTNMAFVIPKRYFNSNGEYDQFVDYLSKRTNGFNA